MLGHAWLTLRQANEALKNGRLEEAHRLLCRPDAEGHKGSWELMQQVAQGFVERGARQLQHEDIGAAWTDLLQAEQIGGVDREAARLRQALAGRGMAEALELLETSEPARAADLLGQLRDRKVCHADLPRLEEASRSWVRARDLAGRGEFAQALQESDRTRRLLPIQATEHFHEHLEQTGKRFATLVVELLEAVARENWREVLLTSEKVLVLAPQHAEARKARARAWKSIEPETTPAPEPEPSPPPRIEPARPRFLLWIDGVGGFLVCLGTRVTLGQATPDAAVDVPLFADISRVHATISRDAEGYLLEAPRPVQVNGQPAERALLRPGDRVTLGSSCQFQFVQPVPISATARLDLTSGHRLPLAIDKVLLMADTLILGPGPQTHVLMPELTQPVILFRHQDSLGVRHGGKMTIDGESCRGRGTLTMTSKVCGAEFAFALEPVGSRLGR